MYLIKLTAQLLVQMFSHNVEVTDPSIVSGMDQYNIISGDGIATYMLSKFPGHCYKELQSTKDGITYMN